MRLQPNFSWQKYEGAPEDQKEQFQYQLQNQHVQVSNSVNSIIDDDSFWTAERRVTFTWVDRSKPLYTKSLATGPLPVAGFITIPTGITGDFTIVYMQCCVSDGTVAASNTLNLPHLDVTAAANNVGIVRNGTDIIISTGGTDRSAYSGYVTIYYIKN
jgi:hypothetical protein